MRTYFSGFADMMASPLGEMAKEEIK